MIRRALRTCGVLAALTAGALLVSMPMTAAFGAGSDAEPEYGWWNKSQVLPVQGDIGGLGAVTAPTIPAPATVPADGMQVASDGSGPSAIAAVRYQVAAGGTMTLKVADGTKLTGTEQLVACPVQGGFTPAQNGRWDTKPAYDPTTCVVKGTVATDGTSFAFDVPATFASVLGDVSIVIVPASVATPFSVPFQKPTADSFVVTTPAQSASDPLSSPVYSPGGAFYTAPTGSPESFSTPAALVVGPPASAGGQQVAGSPVASALDVSTRSNGRTVQLMAVLMLAAIGGAMWWLGSQQQRTPKLLGSVGGSSKPEEALVMAMIRTTRPRGVGRFARHRHAPPTAI